MNPIYSILESRHSWLILAGIAFTAACLGAIMMLVYAWPHIIALIWFYAGVVVTIVFLVQAASRRVRELRAADAIDSRGDRKPRVDRAPDR